MESIDAVLVVVEGGDVVAPVEDDPFDRTAVALGEEVGVRRLQDVVLGAVQQQQRAGDLAVPALERSQTVFDERQQGAKRRRRVGRLDHLGVGDVRPDPRKLVLPFVDHAADQVDHLGGLRLRGRVDARDPDHLRMAQRRPEGERPAHREPGHDDLVAPSGQALIRHLDLTRPVGPRRRLHVVDVGPMAGQPGQLDGEPGRRKRLGHAPHRARVAREAVDAQCPGSPALSGPRLGTWEQFVGHGRVSSGREGGRRGRWRSLARPTTPPGTRPPPTPGRGRCSSPGTPGGTCRSPSTARG